MLLSNLGGGGGRIGHRAVVQPPGYQTWMDLPYTLTKKLKKKRLYRMYTVSKNSTNFLIYSEEPDSNLPFLNI